jgi:hypothetical protein
MKLLFLKSLKSKNTLLPIAIVIVAIALVTAIFFYNKYQQAQKLLTNPSEVTKEQVAELIKAVGKLIELPTGETPTIATVSDKTKLANQSFFQRAENGDKVLIYTQAKKAILYRPSINKIVEVSPVNLGSFQNPQQTTKPSAQASPTLAPAKIIILNGTNTIGLTNVAEKQLKAKIPNVVIADKDNANKKDYEKTLVSFTTEAQKAEATQIASILGGEVVPMPKDENAKADILIILGTDFVGGSSSTTTTKP